jgi:hypothetical protein
MKSIYRQATTVNCRIRWAAGTRIGAIVCAITKGITRDYPSLRQFKNKNPLKTKTSRRSDWSKLAVLGGENGGGKPLTRVKNFNDRSASTERDFSAVALLGSYEEM